MIFDRWHEHDPVDLLESVYDCLEGAVEEMEELGYDRSAVKALGITNQRETTLLWNRETGEPMCNAIVWDDARTAAEIHRYQRLLDDQGIELIGSDLELELEGVEEVKDGRTGGTKKVLKGTSGIKELFVVPFFPCRSKVHSNRVLFGFFHNLGRDFLCRLTFPPSNFVG